MLGNLLHKSFTDFMSNVKYIVYYSLIATALYSVLLLLIPLALGAFLDDILALLLVIPLTIIFVLLVGYIGIIYVKYIFGKVSGENLSLDDCKTFAKQNIFSILLTGILFGLILILGFIALIIPGIIMSIYFIFALYSPILREKFYLEAIKYSYSLTQSNWWRTFFYVIVSTIIVAIVAFPVSLVLGILTSIPALVIVTEIISYFFQMFLGGFTLIFLINYFLQLEKEKGLDSNTTNDIKQDNDNEA